MLFFDSFPEEGTGCRERDPSSAWPDDDDTTARRNRPLQESREAREEDAQVGA